VEELTKSNVFKNGICIHCRKRLNKI